MTMNAVLQFTAFFAVLIGLALPLGAYMARVYTGEARLAERALGPVERLFYRLSGVRADEEMGWAKYAASVLLFNLLGALFVYVLQRTGRPTAARGP